MLKSFGCKRKHRHKQGAREHGTLRTALAGAGLLVAATSLSGCASLGSSGPNASRVTKTDGVSLGTAQIMLVDLTNDVARHVMAAHRTESMLAVFGDSPPAQQVIGLGDTLDVTIWEAPPAALFGSSVGGAGSLSTATSMAPQSMQNSSLPPQMVSQQGTIMIPFVGEVRAADLSPQQLERTITSSLQGKAHAPQVLVRVAANRSANVTVVGDVASSASIPLTPKGERLLDALAGAGGVKQPTGKMTIRLTRGTRTVSQTLDSILLDPAQNIPLRPGDVLTAMHKPYAFTALGATGNNAEVPFEATGLTLAQALARAGGLQDSRADTRGVFIFRLEPPEALISTYSGNLTPDGRVPVIYKVDLNDPRSFFVAQGFPIRDGDILYVSNAPLADLQKFVSIVSSMAFSVIGITNAVQ